MTHTQHEGDMKTLPHVKYLRAIFHYEENTGDVLWKINASASRRVGTSASRVEGDAGALRRNTRAAGRGKPIGKGKKGARVYIILDNQTYRRDQIVWKLVNGTEPPEVITHKNGDLMDDRIQNLVAG